jgi:predicted CoA-binding protein
MINKKTLVLGASPNPERYGYKATAMLKAHGFDVIPFGLRAGKIGDTEIITNLPDAEDVDTVTLYVGPQNQQSYIDYVIALKPKRVIFNPGTENEAFEASLKIAGIQPVVACTLVMLQTGQY